MVASVWPLVLASLAGLSAGGGLVGPGAVASYQGASHGRRYGPSVRVKEPAVGFFAAGSSIKDLNGLYARVNPEDASDIVRQHEIQLLYKHDYTGWHMGLVKAPAAVAEASGKPTEWLFIDNDGVDRFRHDGETIVPGSGSQWSHVHRTENAAPNPKAGNALAETTEDDEEEYPWQLVGIGDANKLNMLRRQFQHYKHTVQKAIEGSNLPNIPFGGSKEEEPPEDLEVSDLLSERGDELCLPENGDDLAAELDRFKRSRWAQAVLHLRTAACHRLRREFIRADELLDAATDLFPRYREAIFERAKLLTDTGEYKMAVRALELVLRSDREWPNLDAWLVRASANVKREEAAKEQNGPSAFEQQETEHCVAWRKTAGCKAGGAREPPGDLSCNTEVPQDASGYCECKSEGIDEAQAMKVGCAHPPFRCSDECSSEFGHTKGWMPADVQPPADSCKLRADGSSPDWCSPNHYAVLGVPCDLPRPEEGVENELMKRAYKRRSLQLHPDKAGGSTRAFQRVAAAHAILSDPEKRSAFDNGAEFERKKNGDGSLGPTYREDIEKKYFPERFDFAPFGDPHGRRKEREAYKQRALERKRQDELIMDMKMHERREQMERMAKERAKGTGGGETSKRKAAEAREHLQRVEAERQAQLDEAKATESAEVDEQSKATDAAADTIDGKVEKDAERPGLEKPKGELPKQPAYRSGPEHHKKAGWGPKKEEL